MKGIIVQIGDQKSVVMFNNGKLGAIATRPDFQIGTIVTSGKSINKRLVALFSAAACLVFAFALGGYLYFTPVGYISVSVNPEIELGYNCFSRTISVKPLNADAVPLLYDLDVKNQSTSISFKRTFEKLIQNGYIKANSDVRIIIAEDNIRHASKVEADLMVLSDSLKAMANTDFSIKSAVYTLDMYHNIPKSPATTEEPASETEPSSSTSPTEPQTAEPSSTTEPSQPQTTEHPPKSSSQAPPSTTDNPNTAPPTQGWHNDRNWDDWCDW